MKYYDFFEKQPKLPSLIIIEGTERVLSERVLKTIEERLDFHDGHGVSRFTAPRLESFRPISEALQSLGFFSERRLIIVRDTQELRAQPRRDLWALTEGLDSQTTLVIEDLFPPLKKTKPEPFGQLAPKGSLRIDTTANAAVRTQFVQEQVTLLGAAIEPAAVSALAEGEGELSAILNDLEKLSLGGKKITLADLAAETLSVDDPKAYRYASAVLEGKTAEALRIAHELFAGDPRGAAVPLLSALATEYSLVWELTRVAGALPARFRWRERALKPLAQRLGARGARRGFERALRGFEAAVTGGSDDGRTLVEAITAECAFEREAIMKRANR
jgi:DNA polymerase III delta subunit